MNQGTRHRVWASGPARLKARLIPDCSVPRVLRSPSRPTTSGVSWI
jgi:hypothetical protein